MSIKKLIEISRFYGKNPEYVLAGGGNTSFKNEDVLYVKASGFSLADVTDESFVKMDRKALAMIWEKTYPPSSGEREKEVLADLMAARKQGEEQKRPSVEALLHDIIPFSYVVHLHPALVNGLCCSKEGEKAAIEIFGDEMLWIPSIDPGYVLSSYVRDAMKDYFNRRKKQVQIILLQNHGVFAGGHCENCINSIYNEIMSKIEFRINRKPDFKDEVRIKDSDIIQILKELAGASALMQGSEVSAFVKNRESFYPVSSAYTPDHIVYSGSDPLFIEENTAEVIRDEWKKHTERTGKNPKIIAVQNLGIFSAAATEKAASLALELFKDTIKVAVYTESFGGSEFMTAEKIDFINNWEVERFRSSVSTK